MRPTHSVTVIGTHYGNKLWTYYNDTIRVNGNWTCPVLMCLVRDQDLIGEKPLESDLAMLLFAFPPKDLCLWAQCYWENVAPRYVSHNWEGNKSLAVPTRMLPIRCHHSVEVSSMGMGSDCMKLTYDTVSSMSQGFTGENLSTRFDLWGTDFKSPISKKKL